MRQDEAARLRVALAIIVGVAALFWLAAALLPPSVGGYYAEVVGAGPNTIFGHSSVRFIWIRQGGTDWGYCQGAVIFNLGASNRTFFYFSPYVTVESIRGVNASATQLAYQRGAVCPP